MIIFYVFSNQFRDWAPFCDKKKKKRKEGEGKVYMFVG
jgi:hypothetical protein